MEGIKEILIERDHRYGDFTDNSRVSQDLCAAVRYTRDWDALPPVAKEAIEMILHKIARIVCGDPTYDDSWADIQGYAKIAQDRLCKEEV